MIFNMLRIAPTCAILCLWAASPLAATETRPNVLFILVDDLGRPDLSGEGSTYYETPHIDRLARQGVRFEFGYSTSRVCSPSRASIMTGKYPARVGITDWIGAQAGYDWERNTELLPARYLHSLPAEEITIAEAFQAAGYATFFAGKWHLGGEGSLPEDHGFEINVGGHHRGSPPGGFFSPYNNPKMKDGPPGESLPIRLAEETARFIKSREGQPFFAFLSFYSVHGPIQTTQTLWEKYRDKALDQPSPTNRFLIDRTLPVRQTQDNPIYAGMMETMDTAVGNVLNTIEELGLADNTIVVFTSDNGGVTSGDSYSTASLPFRGGKGRQWEGGIRVPYYIKAPSVGRAGHSALAPATGADFFPTLLELAGIERLPNQHVDGISLVPALRGQEPALERPLFWHYPHYGNQGGEPSSVILDRPWKLIHYYEDGRDELYRIDDDIGEQTDLASEVGDRVVALRQTLDRHLSEVSAEIPLHNPRFDRQEKRQQQNQVRNELLPKLEQRHANYLSPDFQPNPSWWGSTGDQPQEPPR